MDYTILKKIIRDAFRRDRVSFPQVDILTVAHDLDRAYRHNGKYYAPHIDTLEDDLRARGARIVSVSRIMSSIKGDIAHGDVRSPEGSFARALLQKRLIGTLARGRYAYSSMEERIWARILDETGARKVIAIQPSRELCVACHERGVWVADMQHGVIGETHEWYGEKFRASEPREWFPDAILCWDHGSAEVISSWGRARGIATPVIGNRWLARFAEPAADDRMVRQIIDEQKALEPPAAGRKTVLLSLSWGEVDIPNGFMVPAVEAAIRSTSSEYRWFIRLHPNQQKGFATDEGERFLSYFQERLSDHAYWEWPTKTPLPIVLSETDAHLTWWSSVSIEAAQMGVKTALLSPRMRGDKVDYYGQYRQSGMVEAIEATEPHIRGWLAANAGAASERHGLGSENAAYQAILSELLERRAPASMPG